jgi:hypothetical protein
VNISSGNAKKMDKISRNRILSNSCILASHECARESKLLRFTNGRNNCRERLRQAAGKYSDNILNYFITDHELHVLIKGDAARVSDIMRYTASLTAADYRLRTDRPGPFWQQRYKMLLVENGVHLLRLNLMLDSLMVDRKACIHPGEWEQCGYNDLTGIRKRYTAANLSKLAAMTSFNNAQEFRTWYVEHSQRVRNEFSATIEDVINATAIGSERFVSDIANFHSRGYSAIRKIIPHETISTYALFFSAQRKLRFTRSLKRLY